MTFRLPRALQTDDDREALARLRRYYRGSPPAVGSLFDAWDTTGTRATDADRFTADDVLAVTTLSVTVPPSAAHAFLTTERDRFHDLLVRLGPDRDLVDEPHELGDDWPGWGLMDALRGFDNIGTTIASKLLARKRPRLRPIWDTVVAGVTGTGQEQWEPLRQALRAHDGALHRRLVDLRTAADLPDHISALRVFDVISWLEGKDGASPDGE